MEKHGVQHILQNLGTLWHSTQLHIGPIAKTNVRIHVRGQQIAQRTHFVIMICTVRQNYVAILRINVALVVTAKLKIGVKNCMDSIDVQENVV